MLRGWMGAEVLVDKRTFSDFSGARVYARELVQIGGVVHSLEESFRDVPAWSH